MNTRILFLGLATAGLVHAAGCGGNVDGQGPDVPETDAAGGGDGAGPGCIGAKVMTMVALPQGYSIDATEVSRCQYQAWLDTSPSTVGQDPWCAWNTTYVPTGVACGFPPEKDGDLPVGCVDWCDAYAYCKGVGKRLCGKIGGGPNAMDDHADATKSQWYNACSSGGKYDYTYGDTYDFGSKCNDADRDTEHYSPVGGLAECHSSEPGFAGVYDLSGNVWEFEDSCDGSIGEQDFCERRGGSNLSGEGDSSCGNEGWAYRDYIAVNIGFRCCSQ